MKQIRCIPWYRARLRAVVIKNNLEKADGVAPRSWMDRGSGGDRNASTQCRFFRQEATSWLFLILSWCIFRVSFFLALFLVELALHIWICIHVMVLLWVNALRPTNHLFTFFNQSARSSFVFLIQCLKFIDRVVWSGIGFYTNDKSHKQTVMDVISYQSSLLIYDPWCCIPMFACNNTGNMRWGSAVIRSSAISLLWE